MSDNKTVINTQTVMIYRNSILLLSSLFLFSCSSVPSEEECFVSEKHGLQKIEQSDVHKFWRPSKKRTRVSFGRTIENAIGKGRVGYVIVNQTINLNGKISNIEIVDSYPDDFFVQPVMKVAKSQQYRPRTCEPVPVRYETVHYFANNQSSQKKLVEIYKLRKKDL